MSQLAGTVPAIIFPTATFVQLVRVIRARSAGGVSVTSWTLFGVANVALYLYTARYTEWQSIIGMLLTAALDFAIAIVALYWLRAAAAERERDLLRDCQTAQATKDLEAAGAGR